MRGLIALLFALLLPLQTLASIAMPIRGGQADGMARQQAVQEGHCQHEAPPAGQPPSGSACEQCGLCHLACAGMMPTAEFITHGISSGSAYAAETVLPLVSHTPEEPNPPPVASRS